MILVVSLLGCADSDPCRLNARPETIDDALNTIEALPSPVSLSCFLTSLDRPLGLEFTSDTFSAQPAQGYRSPRIFVRSDTLTMSVVPVGLGRDLLEFGESHESGLTVKAELAFPIELPLAPDAAFDKALAFPGADETGCRVCHLEEIEVAPGQYANTPLRPPPSMIVPLDTVLEQHEACDWDDDPYRCEMFSALFDHGRVDHEPFPDAFLTLTTPD